MVFTGDPDLRIRVKAPARAEPRHPGRRQMTDAEAEVLARYPAGMRRELLRRWRAKELYVRDDGRLAEVDPNERQHARGVMDAARRRDEAKRRKRRTAAAARSRNRRR